MPTEDADRDAVAEALGRHYAEGRLDAEALDARLGRAYAADASPAAALEGLPPLAPLVAPAKRRWGRRHGESDTAEPGWVPTTERFVDPSTARVMRVWYEPAAGKRHYLAD